MTDTFVALGKRVTSFEGFDVFPTPEFTDRVKLVCTEVTAVCPVTGQPDFYTIEIEYEPDQKCVESKTMKLYLQKYRNEGVFCERFADQILVDLLEALDPKYIRVTTIQTPRGGISIQATASFNSPTYYQESI